MAFTVADGLIRLLVDEKELQRAVTSSGGPAATAADQAGQTVGSRFGNALRTAAIPVAALAGGAIARSIGKATDFDEQLRVINTVAKVSDETLKGIGEDILAVSRETGKATDDLTAGFYDLVSAGVPAEKAIAVLRTSAQLATGALGTTGEAVDLLTSVLNAYELEADQATRVSDIFAQAVADGKVTVAELGGSIAQIAPLAASAGISIEEVAASAANLTAKGYPASEAFTNMRQAISALLTPNETLNKLQEETGKKFADIAAEKGLSVALEELRLATQGNNEEFGKALGSTQAYQYALATTGENADDFAVSLDKVTTAGEEGGVALGQYEEVMKSGAAQGRKFVAELQAAAITLGGPFVSSIGGVLAELGPLAGGLTGAASAAALMKGALGGGAWMLNFVRNSRLAAVAVRGLRVALLAAFAGAEFAQGLASRLGGTLASALDRIPGMPAVKAAGSRIGNFLGSTAGKAFGITMAVVFVAWFVNEIEKQRAEIQGQLDDIAGDVSNQVATGTTAQLEQSAAAIKTAIDQIEAATKRGPIQMATPQQLDALKGLVEQYNVVQTELNRRAEASAKATQYALEGAKNGTAAAARDLANELPTALDKNAAAVRGAAARWATLSIGEKLNELGPMGIRQGAQLALGVASGLRQQRDDIGAAIRQLKSDMEHPLSRSKEVAKRIGQLFGHTVASGLKSSDPVVKKQAEGTRALIEAQLIETIKAGGEAGKKVQEELEKKLKSKDPDVRKQAERTKSIVDAALKDQPPKTPGEKIAQDLARDIGQGEGTVGRAAYRLGVSIARNVLRGVTGSGVYTSGGGTVTGSGGVVWSGAKIDQFAEGTMFAPGGLAFLHEGEIVVPRRESDAIRNGTGAAAPNVFGDVARPPDVTLVMPDARNRDPFEVLERARRLAGFGAFTSARASTAAPG